MRTLAILVLTPLAATALLGCGSGDDTPEAQAERSADAKASAPPPGVSAERAPGGGAASVSGNTH